MKVASPKAIRKRVQQLAEEHRQIMMTAGQRGAIVGTFHKALEDYAPGNSDSAPSDKRYLVWGFCFTPDGEKLKPMRTADLTDGELYALKKWIGFQKHDTVTGEPDEWTIREAFTPEARQVLTMAETIIFLGKNGSDGTIGDFLEDLDTKTIDFEPGGMVHSAIMYMGGVVNEALPPEAFPPVQEEESTQWQDAISPEMDEAIDKAAKEKLWGDEGFVPL